MTASWAEVISNHVLQYKILFDLLGGYCGKTAKQVMKDSSRDLWLSANDALEYGIIDEIVVRKEKK